MSDDELLAAALRQAGDAEARCALGPGDRLSRELLKGALFGAPALPRVGRYQAVRLISSGGMGIVFEARDEVLGRAVALKLLRTDLVGDDLVVRERIRREARSMARLSHPNVVQVYEYGEHDGDIFLALEYVDGQTLRSWLGAHAGPAHRAAICARFVAAGRGLAAAHAAGLVHRDFKPDNVLLSGGGRTRLADFGLARVAGEQARAASGAAPIDALTRAGAVLGTTAYMAPEQLDGQPTDARTDQFSFSVALYEALYGTRPYAGETVAALRAAMRAGRLDPGDEAAGVPGWLRAVLLRGLSVDPAARYPDMDALLDALLDDLDARRRRRRAQGTLALLGVVLLGVSGQALWERWQAQRAERAVAQTIAAVEQRVAALRDSGEAQQAAQRFDDLVAASGLKDDAALAAAWLREARRREGASLPTTRDDLDPVLSAYTNAFSAADSAPLRAAILTDLAAALRQRSRWSDLDRLLARMAHDYPDAYAADAIQALRLEAALAGQDPAAAYRLALSGGHTALLPLLEPLSQALRTDVTAHLLGAEALRLPGREAPVVMLSRSSERGLMASFNPTVRAPPLYQFPQLWDRILTASPQGGPTMIVTHRIGEAESVLWEVLASGEKRARARWDGAGQPLTVTAADMDGDGADELYLGEGPPSRQIFQLTREDDGAWRRRPVGDAVVLRSDPTLLEALDVDGDGTDELLAAIGPWTSYDVQLLGLDASGQLHSLARRKMGVVSALAMQERPGQEPLLVLSKLDQHPNIRVFPDDAPFGEPAGLYRMRVSRDGFTVASYQPFRFPSPLGSVVADVDGDGLDDVIEIGSDGDRSGLQVHRQQPDGTLAAPLLLWGPRLLSVMEVDGDPGAELAVALPEHTPEGAFITNRLWLLGTGADTLPPLRRAGADLSDREPAAPLESIQPLADIGLTAEAAQAFERIARTLEDDDVRAQAWLRAAELHEGAGRPERALPLYLEAAAAAPAWTADALEGARRCDIDAAHYAEAISAAEAALATPGLSRMDTARLTTARADLLAWQASGAGMAAAFDGGSALRWSSPAPLGLRRTADGLHIHAHHGGAKLSAPLDHDGKTLVMELDMSLHQMEWSAGVAVHIHAPDGQTRMVFHLQSLGGGGLVRHDVVLGTERALWGWDGADAPARLEAGETVRYRFRCQIFPTGTEISCSAFEDGVRVKAGHAILPPLGPQEGPYRLTISTIGDDTAAVEATIHALRLVGVTPAAAAEEDAATQRTAALLDGQLPAALALTPDTPTASPAERVLRAELLLRLGHIDEARALLVALTADGAPTALLGALRRSPGLLGPVLTATAPQQVFTWIRDAWGLSRWVHPRSPRSDAELLELLAGLDAAAPRPDAVARDLLLWRGEVRARRGDRVLADQDLRAALALAPEATAQPRGRILIVLAGNAAEMGDTERARSLIREARAIEPAALIDDWIAASRPLRGL